MISATQILSFVPFPALLFAATKDVAVRLVPNWVTAVIVLCAVAARTMSGDLALSLAAAAAVFALLFLFWHRGWMGGGDVKLLSACALLVSADRMPTLLMAVAVIGGVLALAYLLGRYALAAGPRLAPRASASVIGRVFRAEIWRIRRHAPLPYACAIAAGSIFTLMAG